MTPPPGLLAAALLFWGYETGFLLLAAPCAALAEAWRLLDRRFVLARADFSRVSDACSAILFCMAAYLYLTRPPNAAFMALSAWLPLATLPLLAAQLYSARGRVDVRALFVFLRRRPAEPEWTVDVAFPYLIVCLIAAGAANRRTAVFYPAAALLTGWALWPARPRTASVAAWAALASLCAAVGYEGQLGLARLQTALETAAVDLFFGVPRSVIDPEEASTALGHIGRLKLSDRIAVRVAAPPGKRPPPLLRSASYDAWRGRRWLALDPRFIPAREEAGAWDLEPRGASTASPAAPGAHGPRAPARRVALALSLERGTGLLPLPPGASRLEGLPFGVVSRNGLGDVRIADGPGLAAFDADVSPEEPLGRSLGGAPAGAKDLEIPAAEAPVLSDIVRDLALDRRRPREALAALSGWFGRNFRYSLYRDGPDPGPRALDEFLLKTRAGHCEYFATAAVLLLRAAGIPARYAAGYSVQEYSRLQRAWIARDRHAHAWALAWIDGTWVDFDATPASWSSLENGRAPWWESLRDAASWLRYAFLRWRWRRSERGPARPWLRLGVAVLAAFAVKWLRELRAVESRSSAAGEAAARSSRGSDSPWYAVERRLSEEGFPRRAWEAWPAWLERVAALPACGVDAGALRPLLELHCRRRFDPQGLAAEETSALEDGVSAWLRSRTPPPERRIAAAPRRGA